jgi:uncharacterized membrane protein YkvA (DUF1232 family)
MMNERYSEYYSENSLWEKIKKVSKIAGTKVVYAVLLLYYTMQDKGVSIKTKVLIAAALGYFILPTDAIFDLTPLIGYSDDLGVLLFALVQISSKITPDTKERARNKLQNWFDKINDTDLEEIEKNI